MLGHIFNEVDTNKKKLFYDSKCFDLDYFDAFKEKIPDNLNYKCEDIDNDLYKKGLKEVKDKEVVVEYDDEKIKKIISKFDEEIILISGDFWGIQKFIFNEVATKNAAKVLRSRSAKVQIITKIVVNILKNKGAEEVLFGAGKFLLVGDKKIIPYIKELQKKLDKFFIKNYFGENGFILSYVETKKEYLEGENEEIKEVLLKLAENNEKLKFNKFRGEIEHIIDIFKNANSDDKVCELCKKRVKKGEYCLVCEAEVKLGTLLTKFNTLSIVEDSEVEIPILWFEDKVYGVKFGDNEKYDISNKPLKNSKKAKWQLKSYVPLKDKKIKTFEEILDNKSGLMALKADVDRLGKTFRDFYYKNFKKFNRLSRELNFFFSNYVPFIIEKDGKYKDSLYVVFAGGDDLFIIGRYDVVVEFAKDIRKRFVNFALNKATLSMGLVMFKENTPIKYVSELADDAEKRAKSVKKDGVDRDGIDIFGISMKFDEFLDIEEKFSKIVEKLKDEETTSFYYKLIEIINMAKRLDSKIFDPKNALWKSKLNYAARNFKNRDFLSELDELIEEYKDKVLPSLFLTIYKRRDNG